MAKNIEWFIRHIKPLLEIGSEYNSKYPGEYYTPREWAVVKLVGLNYYLDIYTKIIPKHFTGKMRYIDLLAGNGLNQIKSTGDIIAGSALLAAHTEIPFDEYIFIEENSKYCSDLDRRTCKIPRAFHIHNGDCNILVPNLVESFNDNDHYLAFIDNEGLDVSWGTLLSLFRKKGDLIINFQTNGINRTRGRAENDPKYEKVLTRLYGDDGWKSCKSEADMLELYKNNIMEQSDRKQIVTLHVQGTKSYSYDLILAAKQTSARNPWLQPMRHIGSLFNEYGPDYVKTALQRAAGKQSGLRDYFNY